MGLDTENAGALTGSANPNAGNTHDVEILIGTYIKSVGRDVKAGEFVTISNEDYRFLKPYRYCKDADVDDEASEQEVAEDTEDETDENDQTTDEDSEPKTTKAHGKRRHN